MMDPKLRPAQGAAGCLQLPDSHDPALVANELEDAAPAIAAQVRELGNAQAAMVTELTTGRIRIAERQHFGSKVAARLAARSPRRSAASPGSLGAGDGLLDTRHDRVEYLLAHHHTLRALAICFSALTIPQRSAKRNSACAF